jgi:hypothetical protein
VSQQAQREMLAAFQTSIALIGGVIPNPEMPTSLIQHATNSVGANDIISHAGPVVAGMTDVHIGRNHRSTRFLPSDLVGFSRASTDRQEAIPVGILPGCPHPTGPVLGAVCRQRAILVDLWPEALGQRHSPLRCIEAGQRVKAPMATFDLSYRDLEDDAAPLTRAGGLRVRQSIALGRTVWTDFGGGADERRAALNTSTLYRHQELPPGEPRAVTAAPGHSAASILP